MRYGVQSGDVTVPDRGSPHRFARADAEESDEWVSADLEITADRDDSNPVDPHALPPFLAHVATEIGVHHGVFSPRSADLHEQPPPHL
jgi:hypothetical protein